MADAYRSMSDRVGDAMAGATVQQMAAPGVETIVGVVHHPLFGPLLMFGMGGIATELLDDRSFRILPVTDLDAAELVRSLRASPLLFGYRGSPPVAVGALEDLLQRVASLRRQMMIHLGVLAVTAVALPLRISGLLGDPWVSAPALWLVASMTLSIGAPFAALSATAPLIQAWYGRIHGADANPYALYAASNLGSLLALLAYPLFIEPFARLGAQSVGWSLGYGGFALITAGLVLLAWRARDHHAAALEPSPPITWRQRLVWIILAALPSSLMLGVTTHLTTDVASAPFLWVLPLSLYLLTFIIAFQNKPAISPHIGLMLMSTALIVCIAIMPFGGANVGVTLAIHLATFFLCALVCHQALVARRPDPSRLTDFYLCMSIGGVVGGVGCAATPAAFADVAKGAGFAGMLRGSLTTPVGCPDFVFRQRRTTLTCDILFTVAINCSASAR